MVSEEAKIVSKDDASKNDTTYILMAHKEAKTVSKGWCFKERHHVQADGTRRGRNREQGVVLQRTTPRTY